MSSVFVDLAKAKSQRIIESASGRADNKCIGREKYFIIKISCSLSLDVNQFQALSALPRLHNV